MADKASFNKLKNTWYKKLKESGFEDIEDSKNEMKPLNNKFKPCLDFELQIPNEIKFNSVRDYYIRAEHFLNSYSFKSKLEQNIWELHTAGVPYREIAKRLKSSTKKTLSKDVVNRVIKSLRLIMSETDDY